MSGIEAFDISMLSSQLNHLANCSAVGLQGLHTRRASQPPSAEVSDGLSNGTWHASLQLWPSAPGSRFTPLASAGTAASSVSGFPAPLAQLLSLAGILAANGSLYCRMESSACGTCRCWDEKQSDICGN